MSDLIRRDDLLDIISKLIYANQGIEERTPKVEQELKVAEWLYDRIRIMPSIKLRKMKVEECAGHTFEYAMGWKACIEWLESGGDNQYFEDERRADDD